MEATDTKEQLNKATYTRWGYTWGGDIHTGGHIYGGTNTRRGIRGGDVHTEREVDMKSRTTWRDIHGGNIHMEGNVHEGTYTRRKIHTDEHTH